MTADRRKWWQEFGAMLAGMSAIAGIHAIVVVPSILSAAQNQAQEIAADEAALVREQVLRELDGIRSQTDEAALVREQVLRELDGIRSQLTRIEEWIQR